MNRTLTVINPLIVDKIQTLENVDYKYLIIEILNSIFQLNSGLLFTLKELFTRPGHSIKAFIEGKRTISSLKHSYY